MKLLLLPSAKYWAPAAKFFYYPFAFLFYCIWFPLYGLIWCFVPAARPDYGIYYNVPRNAFKESRRRR